MFKPIATMLMKMLHDYFFHLMILAIFLFANKTFFILMLIRAFNEMT